MCSSISDTGLSTVYAPDEGDPLLDIVIVHGLQGHPFRTWASNRAPNASSGLNTSPSGKSKKRKGGHRYSLRRVISKVSTNSSAGAVPLESCCIELPVENDINKPEPVYWPRDLAPQECPRSRILVYGYDTKISKYMTGPTNKNHVLSHGKDLLYALCRERAQNRPLVFLAHSLGGIVVKETLAASSASEYLYLKNVVESTAAVIFMGTPHRGSPDLSALGEWARSVLSIFRMETSSAILDTLGLKTSDLERAQESFSGLWSKYDFRVKTFQESLGLTGIHLGVLGNKVVPDYSSLLGDQRERAESIQANHMDMCRFTGAGDPNYRKVAGELRSIYHSLLKVDAYTVQQGSCIQHQPLVTRVRPLVKSEKGDGIVGVTKLSLQELKFPRFQQRYQSIARPAENTCSWLFEHEKYQDWAKGRRIDTHEGLLLLQGKPGAGKSILMKEAHRRISLAQDESFCVIAKFFFHAQGQELEHSLVGMFRSLLYQILPLYQDESVRFRDLFEDEDASLLENPGGLQQIFESLFSRPQKKRAFIFVDALDECDHQDVRNLASFWRQITRTACAYGAQLNVLLSIRDFPHITLSNCSTIRVDHCNEQDIALYVEQRTNLVAIPEQALTSLKSLLVKESRGIFLWAMLMVERMIDGWHDGEGLTGLLTDNASLPRELDTLFAEILAPVNVELKQVTIRLFQWASLSVEPLRLYEWHHILAFIRQPKFHCLWQWQTSRSFTENDDQLERLVKTLSRGLLEVRSVSTVQDNGREAMSDMAGAGSLDCSNGETRVIEFIHESVRSFFLQGRGFGSLDPNLAENPRAAGHLQIMKTCLDYLDITDLDALVNARDIAAHMRFTGLAENDSHATHVCPKNLMTHQLNAPDQHLNTATDRARKENHLFKQLKILSETSQGIDIDQWIDSSQFQIGRGTSGNSICGSPLRLSTDISTIVLQVHPALLSYATCNLFVHAMRAQIAGADPEVIVRRLEKGSWRRWLLLSEAPSPNLKLQDFAKSRALASWLPFTSSDPDNQSSSKKIDTGPCLAKSMSSFELRELIDDSCRMKWRQISRKSSGSCRRPDSVNGSVQSFGSAGSHGYVRKCLMYGDELQDQDNGRQ